RFFAFEGNIETQIFKNFPYVPRDAQKYRDKFRYLLAVRDAKKAAKAAEEKKKAEEGTSAPAEDEAVTSTAEQSATNEDNKTE
ncbi:MAG: hypothetical protein J6Y15_01635, partial [Bacteroidaceae bacterium]|nr:hypothetical protein [Bacteroidaceae bacterium]